MSLLNRNRFVKYILFYSTLHRGLHIVFLKVENLCKVAFVCAVFCVRMRTSCGPSQSFGVQVTHWKIVFALSRPFETTPLNKYHRRRKKISLHNNIYSLQHFQPENRLPSSSFLWRAHSLSLLGFNWLKINKQDFFSLTHSFMMFIYFFNPKGNV